MNKNFLYLQAALMNENSKKSYTKVVSEFDLVMQVNNSEKLISQLLHIIIYCRHGEYYMLINSCANFDFI